MAKKPLNKKQNEAKPQSNSSGLPIGKLFLISAVLFGLASFYVYKVLTTPPPTPTVDLDQWWGPYPISQEKDDSVRPFKIEFSDVMINDLRERLLHTRPLTPPLEDSGFTYGFNTDFLMRVLDYWKNKYNFKERENFFNKYNHFKTRIQGLDIHFMHVTPKVAPDADVTVVPLLLLNGWPSTFRDFYELIPKLTAIRPDKDFVFEVIVPSVPGFAYSEGAARPGFGPIQTAGLLHTLMQRLGHRQYHVHASGTGHFAAAALATLFPAEVRGYHTTFPVVLMHPLANAYILLGSLWPSLVVEPEVQSRLYPLSEHASRLVEETGYLHMQATRPDTIGVALTDSPAGLVAYILEKYSTWSNIANKQASDGRLLERMQLTCLLDAAGAHWASGRAAHALRHAAEAWGKGSLAARLDEIPTEVPTWGIKFKHDLVFHPDCVLKLKYKNYLQSTMVEEGGHFAAMEMPDVLADDIYNAVATFMEFHGKKTSTKRKSEPTKTVYDFTVTDLNGRNVKLDKYRGYVLLIVNVASQCGLTDTNYKELNQLYEKYEAKGLKILAFPCNQFGGQEPGTHNDILKFTKNRGVKFDIFSKVEVNGEAAHPLWQFLKTAQGGTMGDFIKWNFSKFIVDRNGVPVERFSPTTSPLELEQTLAKYW